MRFFNLFRRRKPSLFHRCLAAHMAGAMALKAIGEIA